MRVYRYFSKDSYIGFSFIQYWRIGLEVENVSTLYMMDMDWKDENLPLIGLHFSKYSNGNSRNSVFSREMMHELWDHIISKLIIILFSN